MLADFCVESKGMPGPGVTRRGVHRLRTRRCSNAPSTPCPRLDRCIDLGRRPHVQLLLNHILFLFAIDHMDRMACDTERRFMQRFRQRRMRKYDEAKVLGTGIKLHRYNRLRNDF